MTAPQFDGRWPRMVGVVVGTIALAAGIFAATPAAAAPAEVAPLSTSSKVVDGWDYVGDDLNDEATLCNGCRYWEGNYAGFWQAILWADMFLAENQVDCEFGPITANATRQWQAYYGIAVDGIVGFQTRTTANEWIRPRGDSGFNFDYIGRGGRLLKLYRDPYNGRYRITHWRGNSTFTLLDYEGKTLPGC